MIRRTDDRTAPGVGAERAAGTRAADEACDLSSAGALLKSLRDESVHLVRSEFALARAETAETVSRAGKSAGSIAAGGFVLYAGFLFLLGAVTWLLYLFLVEVGLSAVVSVWLAPLVTGLVAALIGYGMVKKGIETLKNLSPLRYLGHLLVPLVRGVRGVRRRR